MMKCENNDLLKRIAEFKWETKRFKLLDEKDKRKSIYEEGDAFHFDTSNGESINSVTLVKEGKNVDLSFFLNMKPTWFIKDRVLFATFIVGDDPCELHRFVVWFENLDGEPSFHFEVHPLYDDCVCDDGCGGMEMVLMSGHGIGDGTGLSL